MSGGGDAVAPRRPPPSPASTLPYAAVALAFFAYGGLFMTYAPLWFASLGLSTFAIGVVTALQSATRVATPYAWGWLADRSGRRERMLVLSAAASLVVSLGYFVSGAAGWVAFVTALLFVCTSGVTPIAEAALAHRVSSGDRVDIGRYGRVRLWGSIGFIVAVGLGGYALQAIGIGRYPVLVSGVLSLLVVAALRLPASDDGPAAARAGSGVLAVLAKPAVAWFFAGMFFTVLAHASLYAFYSLMLASLGHGQGSIGLLWVVGVAAEVAWFYFQDRWVQRWTPETWLVVAALVAALRFAAIAAFASIAAVLVVAQCLHAVTFAAQHSACVAVIGRHFAGPLRARGQALYTVIGYGASGIVGGVGGGALSERYGFAAVFWAASAAALVGAACGWRAIVAGRRAR